MLFPQISFKEELRNELRFLFECSGNIKEVRHRKSNSTSQHTNGSYRSNRSGYSPALASNEHLNESNALLHSKKSEYS